MYVSPAVRGGGVGDVLMAAVEEWARDRGATSLCFDVVATNTTARRLYELHGLVVTREVERASVDESLELRMRKQLGWPTGR